MEYNEDAQKTLEIIGKGAFLTTGGGDKINTMTIGWGALGRIWQKPAFIVMVRKSRYTHELIEKYGEFTVTVPHADMHAELSFCGTKSGRKIDKIKAMNFELLPSKKIKTPALKMKGIHYECKTVYKTDMDPEALAKNVNSLCYAQGDYHTIYFGEIVNVTEI